MTKLLAWISTALLLALPLGASAQSTMGVLAARLPATGQDGAWTVTVRDDSFTLSNAVDAATLRYYYVTKLPDLDARVGVDILVDPASDLQGFGGILFGFKSDSRFYSILALKGDGTVTVLRRDGDGLSAMMETQSSAFKPGWNRLEIAETGDEVAFSLNGTSLGSVGSEGLGTGGFGIAVGGLVSASFANFTASDETGEIVVKP